MLLNDLRGAFRSLARTPSFTLPSILILAIGLAGTIVMYALVQGVLLRQLPVIEQDRVIVAWKHYPLSGFTHAPFGDKDIDAVAKASRLLENVAGVGRHGASQVALIEDGRALYVNEALVTGGFFEVLGVKPQLGRALNRADDVRGAETVVVISHRLWRRHYAGSRDVVGRRLPIREARFTIVGVMSEGLDYPTGVDYWRTTRSVQGAFSETAEHEVDLIGRLRNGVTIEQATSELTALTRQLEADAPPTAARGRVPVVQTLEDVLVGGTRPILLAFSFAVVLVLLIAAANAANLFAMRNQTRRTELAVRTALGAGRGRIAAQVLAESVVIALSAGALGFLLAAWSLQILVNLIPSGLPRVESIRIDGVVVLFTIGAALATAVLTGLPACLLDGNPISYLRSGGRATPGRASQRVPRAFVMVQVALAIMILAAAGLLTRSILHLQAIDTRLPADRLAFVELFIPSSQRSDRSRYEQFLNQVIAQLEDVPFIASATPINVLPFAGLEGWDAPQFTAEGQSAERAATNPSLNVEAIFPNYFATLQIPILRGRAFTDADTERMPAVAIVSEHVAATAWPDEDPIGKRLKWGGPTSNQSWRIIVGVAAETRYRELTRPRPTMYVPAAQFLMTAQHFAVRTSAPLAQVAAVSRDRIQRLEPGAQVMRVVAFGEILRQPLAHPRFNAFVLIVFGSIAVLLATAGLYAVMGAYVRQRDRDIAVRRALGATATDVRRLVLGEAVWLVAMGAVIGTIGAIGAARVLRGMLYSVDAFDPLVIVGAVLMLMATSLVAAFLPARRAARVDPLVALRCE
jgi:putative ABC transport system permease protein